MYHEEQSTFNSSQNLDLDMLLSWCQSNLPWIRSYYGAIDFIGFDKLNKWFLKRLPHCFFMRLRTYTSNGVFWRLTSVNIVLWLYSSITAIFTEERRHSLWFAVFFNMVNCSILYFNLLKILSVFIGICYVFLIHGKQHQFCLNWTNNWHCYLMFSV